MIPFIVIIFLALVGVVGDFLIKLATTSTSRLTSWAFLTAGLVIYALTAFGWFYAIKHVKLSTLGVWYAVSTVLFLAVVSVFHFKEHLSIPEAIGIFAGVLSLVLLSRFI